MSSYGRVQGAKRLSSLLGPGRLQNARRRRRSALSREDDRGQRRTTSQDCGRQRDQLGQFYLAGVQRGGARRASGADLVRPDDHLRHARRAQSRARRDVHARRLCRLARLHLHGLVHRRRHRRVAVRDAGRGGDGARGHPPLLFPAARGPAPGHLRSRHRVRGDRALFLRQPLEDGTAAARAGRDHPARLHVLSDLPVGAARHCRGGADRALRRALPHPHRHDRARRHRGFR